MKMRRCEDVRRCEDEKMFYRPPLLEEPCAQTLSGKSIKTSRDVKTRNRNAGNTALRVAGITPGVIEEGEHDVDTCTKSVCARYSGKQVPASRSSLAIAPVLSGQHVCKFSSKKLDDGWPESEKDVFQAALRMVVVKDSR